jgi:adenine phosphoribosyltransferase
MPSAELIRSAIRDIPDFPKPGIVFRDITPVLADPQLFQHSITMICETAGSTRVDKVVGIDARGFIFAAAVADRIGAGFIPVRKEGKLPWTTRGLSYTLEYGEAAVEIHEDAIQPGEKVLLVDDLLATGGTASAAVKLLDGLQADLIAATFLIELSGLGGREKLGNHRIESLITYD